MNQPAPLSEASLDQLFLEARTHNVLQGEVSDDTLQKLYDLTKMGPTSANMTPARFVFVRSPSSKDVLVPLMSEGNQEKTRVAPVSVIVGHDLDFFEHLPKLFPHADARSWFKDLPEQALDRIGLQNASMQGAYLILAARALGLDTGPMTGFDQEKVSEAFFPNSRVKANLIVNLGYGDHSKLFPRSPRFDFEEVARIV